MIPGLVRGLGREAGGDITCPGLGGGFSPLQAALIGGVAGSSLEFEEGNSRARGHPAIQVVPALLAASQAAGLSGADLLAGLVLGYEVGARLSRAASLRQGLHPTGTWGVIGAALGVGRVHGRGPQELAQIANIAASYTLSPYVMNSFAGHNVASTFAGLTNHNGLLADLMFQSGFRADPRSLEMTFSRFLSEGLDWEELLADLGRDWAIAGNYFKPYPTCRFTHPAVDALAAMMSQHDLAADEVEEIEVATFRAAAHPTPLPPANAEAMRFSLPYQLAALLILGRLDLETMGQETLQSLRIGRLARKVRAASSDRYEALRPEHNPARVKVRLASGEEFSHEVMDARGDPLAPLPREELKDKFVGLAGPVIGPDRAREAAKAILNLEEYPDVRPLMRMLRPEGAP